MPTLHTLVVLPSRMSSIVEVESLVEEIIADNQLDEDTRGNIMITLTEAVTNAIRHGNKLCAEKQVRIDVWRRRRGIKVAITDEGPGFEPMAVPDPTSDDMLEVEGGRGVFLMRALADEIKFSKGGRCVEMLYEVEPVPASVRQPMAMA